MVQSVIVTYDGQVLKPEQPLDLEADKQYRITITPTDVLDEAGDAWDVLDALAGTVDAPLDWAAEHDHYLYQKR
jgi:predicted DNA-binding antitoxin AbrB/MazE fold protein